jgi:SHS2 domain-containing protein
VTLAPAYTILEHTADIGFEALGDSPHDLFAHAADAFYAIAAEPVEVHEVDEYPLVLSGANYPDLLVNFLSELLYLFDANRFVPARVAIDRLGPETLDARLIGEPRDPARHPWRLIVKAVTYHGLEVTSYAGTWRARVFLDI